MGRQTARLLAVGAVGLRIVQLSGAGDRAWKGRPHAAEGGRAVRAGAGAAGRPRALCSKGKPCFLPRAGCLSRQTWTEAQKTLTPARLHS